MGKAFAKEQGVIKEPHGPLADAAGRSRTIRRRLAANLTSWDWEREQSKFEEQVERVTWTLRTEVGHEQPPKPLI